MRDELKYKPHLEREFTHGKGLLIALTIVAGIIFLCALVSWMLDERSIVMPFIGNTEYEYLLECKAKMEALDDTGRVARVCKFMESNPLDKDPMAAARRAARTDALKLIHSQPVINVGQNSRVRGIR